MANLRDLRKRRKSTANTRKITRTMELVASAKLKKAQDAAAASRPYAEGLRELVAQISAAAGSGSAHALMKARPEGKKVAILLASSDRGLAGAFNANLVMKAIQRAKVHQAAGRTVEFVALGKKGGSTLGFFGYTPTETHTGIVGATQYHHADKVAGPVIQRFLKGQVDIVEVVYARFISAARQVPDSYVMLPVGADAPADASAKDSPKKVAKPNFDYIYIPEPEELLAAIIPLTVTTALFSALLQTTAAEHAARRVAMKNATDAAADMVKAISGAYNRGRQGKITQEIAEIVGAVEAMA